MPNIKLEAAQTEKLQLSYKCAPKYAPINVDVESLV